MSWKVFKSDFVKGMNGDNPDMAKVISDAYEKSVKLGISGTQALTYGPVAMGNKILLYQALDKAAATMGKSPFGVQLDIGLVGYWMGATTLAGGVCIFPGVTGAFIDSKVQEESKSLEDTADFLIDAFKLHSKQLAFNLGVTVTSGYTMLA